MIESITVVGPHITAKMVCDLDGCERAHIGSDPVWWDAGFINIREMDALPGAGEFVDRYGHPIPQTWCLKRELQFCSWAHLAEWAHQRAGEQTFQRGR